MFEYGADLSGYLLGSGALLMGRKYTGADKIFLVRFIFTLLHHNSIEYDFLIAVCSREPGQNDPNYAHFCALISIRLQTL